MSSILRCLRRLSLPLSPRRGAAVVVLAALLLSTFAVAVNAPSQAADLPRWSAGDRATVILPTESTLADTIMARAGKLEPALGLATAFRRRIAVVDDLFHQRRVHEVTYLDRRGQSIGIVRLDPGGRLAMAVRFGYRPSFARGDLDEDRALGVAAHLVNALGLATPNGLPAVRPMLDGTMWAVAWPRWADRAPVDGDGLTVRVWRSGDVHSVTLNERPLARPARKLSPRQAREVLDRLLPTLASAERRRDATIGAPSLHWVAANDQFDPAAADAPAATLRLAYVFELRFAGADAGIVRALAVWIDAETGDLLGGDVLE